MGIDRAVERERRPARGVRRLAGLLSWMAAVTAAHAGLAGDATGRASHCSAAEGLVFSCAIGRKVASVCSVPTSAGERDVLVYRFGAPGAVELSYPTPGPQAPAVVRGGVLAYSAGGGAYLGFTRDGYRYVVYTAIVDGTRERAGVVVERAGRRLAHLPCTTAALSSIGPALFGRIGLVVDDPAAFELP